jgi:hypothetical protein
LQYEQYNETQSDPFGLLSIFLSSQVNYTLTYFADHSKHFSHDAINRYRVGDHIPPRLVWENVREQIVTSPQAF